MNLNDCGINIAWHIQNILPELINIRRVILKAIFKRINWFLESLYAEFIEWAEFLLIGTGGILLAVIMWQSEGLMGKALVIVIAIFIAGGAINKIYSKHLSEKIEHQKDKIILEQMERRVKRIDRINNNLGKMAALFQKYLDDSKEGELK
jgi:hypothetical protein